MKHSDANCDCGEPATSLALRWRCPVCGKTAIMKMACVGVVCDGNTMRKAPELLQDRSQS